MESAQVTEAFKDHFSNHAETYAKYRPSYPDELFAFLSQVSNAHALAWDCATGNGQAARGLAAFFSEVFATDASAAQIEHAFSHPKIRYAVAPAEACPLANQSCDLITVATGIHWFDIDRFYAEVRRVLKPGGVIAVWVYHGWKANHGLSELLTRFDHEILESYWPEETRKWVTNGYRDLPFPFAEILAPEFKLKLNVSKDDILGFLWSWSGTQRYTKARGTDPTLLIREDLDGIFSGDRERIDLTLKLSLRVGR